VLRLDGRGISVRANSRSTADPIPSYGTEEPEEEIPLAHARGEKNRCAYATDLSPQAGFERRGPFADERQ